MSEEPNFRLSSLDSKRTSKDSLTDSQLLRFQTLEAAVAKDSQRSRSCYHNRFLT